MPPTPGEPSPQPCVLSDGRLSVDGVDLGEMTLGLEGHAVWLLSHGALSERIEACDGPRTVSVGRVAPATVLSMLASAGWWARCHSSLELERAHAAGFPDSRLVASGRVKDDGFLKDALSQPVAVLEPYDADDARNIARMASFLERELPDASGAAQSLASCELMGCGGLLSPVLRGPPELALDAPLAWPLPPEGEGEVAEAPALWPVAVSDGAVTAGSHPLRCTVEGLSSTAVHAPQAARLVAPCTRGEWVFLPSVLALGRGFEDPAWPTLETVMTRDEIWRFLEEPEGEVRNRGDSAQG